MAIIITSKLMMKVLTVLSWIIFIGLCIEAGGILFNSIFTMTYNPNWAKSSWNGIDFSLLLNYDKGYYVAETTLMSTVAILKAILFYLIVEIIHDKKLNLDEPFNVETKKFIYNTSYICFGTGLFTSWGAQYTNWLTEKGLNSATIEKLNFGGADVWFFMGIILLVIAQIFKRGIEIQNENDLTI